MPFLHTISRKIQFRTAGEVDNRQKKTMVEESKNVIKIYTNRGFEVVDIHGYQEFKCIGDDMSPTAVEIVATDDHVDEVERSMKVADELYIGSPTSAISRLMIIELVRNAPRGLNKIPAEDGVSDRIIPTYHCDGTGKTVDYNRTGGKVSKNMQCAGVRGERAE